MLNFFQFNRNITPTLWYAGNKFNFIIDASDIDFLKKNKDLTVIIKDV